MPIATMGNEQIPLPARTAGPELTLTNDYIDPIVSTSLNPVPEIMDVPSGTPLQFCWTAVPSSGATNLWYRLGYDIQDHNDPDAWETDFIPFDGSPVCSDERSFFFGTHTFSVEVKDNLDARSRAFVTINVIPAPPTFDILPGSCPNPLSVHRRGLIPAAVPGTVGIDARDIIVSSLEVWINGTTVAPVRARIGDIASPLINGDDCECPPHGADGIDDLVLQFSAEELLAALGPVSGGDVREMVLRGEVDGGVDFWLVDCVTIVGPPRRNNNPLQNRDDVLETLERAYNERSVGDVDAILDDDFTFFLSPRDIQFGNVAVSQWDRWSELQATGGLLDAFPLLATGSRTPRTPLPGNTVESVSWGHLKVLFLGDAGVGVVESVDLSLRYVPGEDNWIQVPPSDPSRFPGEAWYEKAVDYFLTINLGSFSYTTGLRKATFTVRYATVGKNDYWRIVGWSDEVPEP